MSQWRRALACALALPSSIALACSCMRTSPADALDGASTVFEGRVLAISPHAAHEEVALEGGCMSADCDERLAETTHPVTVAGLLVRFSVTRRWKGPVTEEVVVQTADNSTACGFAFEVGAQYLVYAHAEQDDALRTGLCDRTAKLADATEDLASLRRDRDVPAENEREGENGSEDRDANDARAVTEEPPARGGCASCSAGAGSPAGSLGLFALMLACHRTRRTS